MKATKFKRAAALAASALGITSLFVASLGLAGAAPAPKNVYVNPGSSCSPTGPGTQGHPYCTVQEGVNAVAKNGTVHIAAGTYSEKVTISTNGIKLQGVGNASDITVPAAATGNIVTVNAKNVTLSNLKVSGPFTAGNCNDSEYGIFFNDKASGTVTDSSVVNIAEQNAALLGCQQGVAIRVGSQALGYKASATLTDNKISGYQKGGIVVDGNGSSAKVTQNTVTGIGANTYVAQNGIQISRGATGTISQNTVTGNEYTGDNGATSADGILPYLAGKITVRQNVVTSNDVGIDVEGSNNGTYGQNTTTGNTTNGILVETDGYTGTTSGSNTFTQNSASGTGGNSTVTPYDVKDATTGTKTAHTADTWKQNSCDTSNPTGLCS